jgi:hypothetical protein
MIQFIKTALRVTVLQIAIIGALALFKYLINQTGIVNRIEDWFVWIFVAAVLLFIASVGIMGLIERGGTNFEVWEEAEKKSIQGKLISSFVIWARLIPAAVAVLFLLYLFAPATIEMAIVLYVGMVMWNIIGFFKGRQ